MSDAFRIRGPEGVGAENGDLVIETAKGSLVALIYRGRGAQGELVARRRAEAAMAAMAALQESCCWCEGIREDGEKCVCTEGAPDLLKALQKARNTLAGLGHPKIAADICDAALARAQVPA